MVKGAQLTVLHPPINGLEVQESLSEAFHVMLIN